VGKDGRRRGYPDPGLAKQALIALDVVRNKEKGDLLGDLTPKSMPGQRGDAPSIGTTCALGYQCAEASSPMDLFGRAIRTTLTPSLQLLSKNSTNSKKKTKNQSTPYRCRAKNRQNRRRTGN
jgi:hypothetical protein